MCERKAKPSNFERRYLIRISNKMFEDLNNYAKEHNSTSSKIVRKSIENTLYKKKAK